MSDITMCSGNGCSAKDYCYRHTDPDWQSFFAEPPGKDKSCEYFMPNGKLSEITDGER